MIYRLGFLYHTRKPRILSQANKSFLEYQKNLRKARRQVHFQAMQYQDKIEDNYLAKHHQQMKNKHFQLQCSFRKQVFTNAFRVHENQVKWKLRDDGYNSRLNKHLHDEDVRKINRNRILKIMQHESTNYWFNEQNVDKRLKEQTIFPEYIASTQYYYKLFAQALAYQFGDFQELHLLTSTQEIIREKNKILIPLYLQLRNQIASYKKNDMNDEIQRHSYEVERLKSSKLLSEGELKDLIEKQKGRFEQKIKEISQRDATNESKLKNLKNKIKDLVVIFKTWKEYTNIIGITSAQVLRNKYSAENEMSINKTEKEVLQKLKSKETEAFIGSIEEDTQQNQMTFQEYLNKINKQKGEVKMQDSSDVNLEQLDSFIKSESQQPSNAVEEGNIKVGEQKGLGLGELLTSGSSFVGQTKVGQSLLLNVNPEFLNERQTTTSVQILKQHFKDDKEFIQLLNKLGQIDVRYPKLFETVWASIEG